MKVPAGWFEPVDAPGRAYEWDGAWWTGATTLDDVAKNDFMTPQAGWFSDADADNTQALYWDGTAFAIPAAASGEVRSIESDSEPHSAASNLPAAGWYATSDDASVEKWWDGAVWTGFARPAGSTGMPNVPNAKTSPHANGVYTLEPRPAAAKKGLGCFGSFIVGAVVLAAIVVTANVVGSLNAPKTSSSTGGVAFQAPPAAAPLRVLYEVEGTAGSVSLTYSTSTGIEQHDSRLPLMNTGGTAGVSHKGKAGESLYIAAQNRGDSGAVTCRITLDGAVVSENSSSGAYGIAQCNYGIPY
jgi:hypothetical protein